MTTQPKDLSSRNLMRLAEPGSAAHAPRRVCELCGAAIMASQDARLEPNGRWIHEACTLAPDSLYQAG